MHKLNTAGLRELLEQLPEEELRAMLQGELERETPDPEAVRMILRVLEDRQPEQADVLTPQKEAAWKRYQSRMQVLQTREEAPPRWLGRAAALVLILGLLIAVVPQQAEAESIWAMLQRWSSSVMTFLGREDWISAKEYVFETDNPGLRQVYDAVVELGVTDPVVPMWLPEGFEILQMDTKVTPMAKGVWTIFSDGDQELMLRVDIYQGEPTHQFYRDDSHEEIYEYHGTTFSVTRNDGWWVVVWSRENVECFITLDCREEILRRILTSIYGMEDK